MIRSRFTETKTVKILKEAEAGIAVDDLSRQQIGMLRALGFQRDMVSWVFLIESSIVALLGIGLGVGLALIPASQMITDMASEIPGIFFQVPWREIIFVSGLAYVMTLLTTWLPSVQASQVRPAQALRYE